MNISSDRTFSELSENHNATAIGPKLTEQKLTKCSK